MNESDSAPEITPELSAAAHKINVKKLEKAPYDHTGKHPGNISFSYLLRLMINVGKSVIFRNFESDTCLLYTSPSPRDRTRSRMPSSA